MAENTNNIIYRVEVNTANGKVNIDGITKSFEQADKAFIKLQKDVAKGIPNATKNVKQLGDATGSATSATMELSRVISDAPYGIRGMANNITQLVSQLGTASTKAGGLGGALKLMAKQLLGPLGVVFAITAAVSALDYFYGNAKKAADSGDEFKLSAEKLTATLGELYDIQEDVNGKIDDYINLTLRSRELAKEDAKSNEEILKLDKIIEDAKALMFRNDVERLGGAKRLTKEQIALANSVYNSQKEIMEKAEADRKAEFKKMIDNQLEINEGNKELAKTQEGTVKALERQKKELQNVQKEVSSSSQVWKTYEAAIKSVQEKIDEITGGKKGKRDKASVLFDTKQLQKDSLAYVRALQKVEEKIALLSTKDKASRLIIQRDFHIKRLLETNDANSELVKAWRKYYAKVIGIAEDANIQKAEADLSFGERGGLSPEQIKQFELDRRTARIEGMMETSQAISGFMDSEFEREMTIEQNKTNALNNELRERLNNENLSKSERKSIQLEIARNDEELRKKQEKTEKKRFKMQKAANISQALISTYLAASQVFANPAFVDPLSKTIAATATISTGLLNVASIARQKFQSSAGATSTAGALGGGGSDGGNDRSFNFNLAGASRENQLAQTLQNRFDQPIQAYVVGRDITNQQQLQEDIVNNATFG